MDQLTEALADVPAEDLDAIIAEFAYRAEEYAAVDSPYSRVYAAVACAAIDALNA